MLVDIFLMGNLRSLLSHSSKRTNLLAQRVADHTTKGCRHQSANHGSNEVGPVYVSDVSTACSEDAEPNGVLYVGVGARSLSVCFRAATAGQPVARCNASPSEWDAATN